MGGGGGGGLHYTRSWYISSVFKRCSWQEVRAVQNRLFFFLLTITLAKHSRNMFFVRVLLITEQDYMPYFHPYLQCNR